MNISAISWTNIWKGWHINIFINHGNNICQWQQISLKMTQNSRKLEYYLEYYLMQLLQNKLNKSLKKFVC